MILALLLLAQDVPDPSAAAAPAEEEIVVRATYGTTTMLFDKSADGRLHNCRVMVSSGSQRRDTKACQSTPVCYAKTQDVVEDCVQFAVIDPIVAAPPPAAKAVVFELPSLVRPQPLAPGQAGPLQPGEESRETERQRVKLPPLPKAPSNGPVVTFGGGKPE
ncbi:hypothetical protein [Sphingomonas hengshuiensis]|uniref:TonB C-terminal domain-containing protein n=1 Tax=Sphingomonas hengshuiensis TaxID=1609977 RepID=A0A7U5BEE7_9SPHN|nr:hypothetical protein [Sphingomonas hengshuiensis]AJP70730.1 hypothetical protein TS85_01160 [Sphingomonas hengshuiensis]